jgi:hypothetical protein
MSSGDLYEVADENLAAIGQRILVLLRPYSTSVTMRLNQIMALEVLEPA